MKNDQSSAKRPDDTKEMKDGKRMRLDRMLVERGLASTRQKAQAFVGAGQVLVDRRMVDKAGQLVSSTAHIEVKGRDQPYVSRGGLKLAHGLNEFRVDVCGLTCLDVGASTGGFTDCLLQRGARKVFAVDVGYGQLAWRLRQDPNVIVLERTNIRFLHPGALGERVDFACVDTSFISLTLVVPAVLPHLAAGALLIVLVKPQFEVGKGRVGKSGVVRDSRQHEEVLDRLQDFFSNKLSLAVRAVTPYPILGPKGNREFLILLQTAKDPL